MVLAGQGQPGDARRIALAPGSLMVSRHAPGASGATATLAGEVAGLRDDPLGLVLDLRIAGQSLSWRLEPGSTMAQSPPEPGQTVWISILSATLR
jgi:hypothetical protein